MATCVVCGAATEDSHANIRFRLPEPVLSSPQQDRAKGTWKTADDPNEAVMMVVPEIGSFIRALLEVRLVDGGAVRFGVWVGVREEDLHRAFETWVAPEYADLRIEGLLANGLPGWDVLGAPVELAVLDTDATPFCVTSPYPELEAVLTREWDRDRALGPYGN